MQGSVRSAEDAASKRPPTVNAALTLFTRYPDGVPCVGPASAAVKVGVVERA